MSNQKTPLNGEPFKPKNEYTALIHKFLKPQIIEDAKLDKSFWPREMKIAKNLIKKHSFNVLNSMELGFKLNSLAYLVGYEGSLQIRKSINLAKLEIEVGKPKEVKDEKKCRWAIDNVAVDVLSLVE